MIHALQLPVHALARVGRFSVFLVNVLTSFPAALARPGELGRQMYAAGVESLPLVSAAGVSIGVVGWLHAARILADYGSEAQLPSVVAVFVVVGLGPVIAGLVVAGQVGARIGAELGSMRITEQMDALEVMGLNPLRHLVATRVLACVLVLPLLTGVLDALALGAAYWAEQIGGQLSAQEYFRRSLDYLTLNRAVPATLKALVFGLAVGVTACWFGVTARGGTEGVGRAATSSVVTSMFLVLAANVVLVRLIDVLF